MDVKNKILLVEDDPSHQLIVKTALGETYDVFIVDKVSEAIHILKKHNFSLILLDIMLTQGTGFEICEFINSSEEYNHIPIFFLTSKSDTNSKVKGFELGADDYLTKPFNVIELKARVKARLKKSKKINEHREGPLKFVLETQSLFVKNLENSFDKIDLSPNEFKLYYYIIKNKDRGVKRSEILNYVWGDQIHVNERSIDTHISTLRKKLGPYFSQTIVSVHGVGYRFKDYSEIKKIA